MNTFIIAQISGILGMILNIVSYQGKSRKTIIIMQFFGAALFSVNMFMLGAFMGCLLNILGVLRALVYYNKDKIKNICVINLIFIGLYALSYVLVFAVFDKKADAFNLVSEILPLVAMTASTIGFSKTKASSIRKATLISSPLWLIYNCINLSLGGILCEAFGLVSVFIGILRFDRNKNQKGMAEHENANS